MFKKNQLSLPTKQDWEKIIKGKENDPPLMHSYKVLFGKDIDDIKRDFISADALMDDIYWIDGTPFYYYMTIVMKLIQEKFFQDWDAESAATYFFLIIKNKHENGMNFSQSFLYEIKSTAEFLFKNKQYFGLNKTNILRYSSNPDVKNNMIYVKKMLRDI